jgi:putative NADH-flavin reductase
VKLLVVGATGGTGRELVTQALRQGHEVTAFVRDPRKVARSDPRLHVVAGSPVEGGGGDAIALAVRGQDVVISALGRRNSFRSEHLMARSMETIVPAMESHSVRRLIVVSAYGVAESGRGAPLLPRLMYRLLLTDIFADKLAGEDRVRRSTLDWTFVYPVALTNGPRTGKYRTGERIELRGVLPRISRADVADFILTQLGSATFRRKIAVISY